MSHKYMTVCFSDGTETDCIVRYEVIGFYRVHITSIRVELPDDEDGPDLLDRVDRDEINYLEHAIVRLLEWKKEPRYRGDN